MKRKLLTTLLFITIFFAVSAYIITIAQGNKIDGTGQLVNTSIVRINSIPSDVTVYINDQIATKNDNRVEWLEPGLTKVTLKKDGYRAWEKTIDLQSGVVEDIYAQLYPERLSFTKLTSSNVDNIYFASNNDYLFYIVTDSTQASERGLWRLKLNKNIFDIGNNAPSRVLEFDEKFLQLLQENTYKISVAENNNSLLIDFPQTKQLWHFDVGANLLSNLRDKIGFYPLKAEWMANSSFLVLSNDNILSSYEIAADQSYLIYYTDTEKIKYSVTDSIVYFYRDDKKQIYRYQNKATALVKLPSKYLIPETIENIYTSFNNHALLFLQTAQGIDFIDLSIDYSENIAGVKAIMNIAPNGKSVIFNDGINLHSVVIKETAARDAYTTNIHTLEIALTDLVTLNYAPGGKNILVLLKDTTKETRSIWSIDFDGTNKYKLISDELIIADTFKLVNNSIDLYLILQDSGAAVEKVNNIYKYELKLN